MGNAKGLVDLDVGILTTSSVQIGARKSALSDVALGAAIGTFSGIKVIQYTHDHPPKLVDRIMLRTSVLPNGRGGVALAWSLPTR